MAKVLLFRSLEAMAKSYPGLHLSNVVDDISLQVAGTLRMVSRSLGEAGVDFVSRLTKLRLPLADGKTAFVSSTAALAESLENQWEPYGIFRVRSARNLGTEATAGRCRAVSISNARLDKSKARANKLQA